MGARRKKKSIDEEIQLARKERLNNKMLINRFGTFLLEQMSGCIIDFEEQPSLDKMITEFFIPPDKYIPTKEGEFMIKFASGPTPNQINTHILREKCGGPLVPSPKEMYFRDKISRYLKQFQIIYDDLFKELFEKSFKKNEKRIRKQWNLKFIAITKKINKEVIMDKYDRSIQLLEILHERKKKQIYDDIVKEKPLEMARVGHLQERKDFLTIYSGYKSKFDADKDEMSVIPLTEKIGKDAQKLIVKLYSVPYKQLKNMSRNILSGKHAIENCGYDKLFNSNKWLEELSDKDSSELNHLINQINNDKLELKAINSAVRENICKFEKWARVLRELLEEFQVIVSHIMDKEPQFAQYLPTFEKFFKTRAAWYIMNVRKEISDDAIELRKIDNKLITPKLDEKYFHKSGHVEKVKKPAELVFTNAFAARRSVDYTNEANEFNSYLEEIIFAMKKLPNLWKSYVEYL